jgi:hypothetical protein
MEEKRRIKHNEMKKSNKSRDTLGSVVQGLWLFRLFPDKKEMLYQWCSVSRRFPFLVNLTCCICIIYLHPEKYNKKDLCGESCSSL